MKFDERIPFGDGGKAVSSEVVEIHILLHIYKPAAACAAGALTAKIITTMNNYTVLF